MRRSRTVTRLSLTIWTPPSLAGWTSWPEDAKLALLARVRQERWKATARAEQLPPEGDWRYWYLRGGRGSGKTRTGAETLADWILTNDPGEWAIIAPKFKDARDVCVEGPSGLLRALGGAVKLPHGYNRTDAVITTRHGAKIWADGADDGALRIQGKNLRGAWCDEIGLWKYQWKTAWEESLRFAVRLEPARFVLTGTPKQGPPLVRMMLDHPRCAVTHMRMVDNIANLDPDLVAELQRDWDGTRLGRQELEGEFLDDVPGALWTLQNIEDCRVAEHPPLDRVVVGVDPSGAADENTGRSSIGIVVAGYSAWYGQAYVLADCTVRDSPERWARKVEWAYNEYMADLVVAETNFGGDMVRSTIHAANRNLPVKKLTASRGKRARAEPVAAKYEQGVVHHVGGFPRLEEQLTTWVPDSGMDSPDRLDALVWALTELLIDRPGGRQYASVTEDHVEIIRRGDLELNETDANRRGFSYLDAD